MRRYSAYNANHVMTTTAATSMISKNNTTAVSLAAAAPTNLGGRRRSNHLIFDEYFGQRVLVAPTQSACVDDRADHVVVGRLRCDVDRNN